MASVAAAAPEAASASEPEPQAEGAEPGAEPGGKDGTTGKDSKPMAAGMTAAPGFDELDDSLPPSMRTSKLMAKVRRVRIYFRRRPTTPCWLKLIPKSAHSSVHHCPDPCGRSIVPPAGWSLQSFS